MVRFFRHADLPSRRSNERSRAAAGRRRSGILTVESLEPRLAMAVIPGITVSPDLFADTAPPKVQSVSLPAAGTYGTGRSLTFKVTFNEPVLVVGDQTAVWLPVEVGYAMRPAQYVSGSGTSSLTFRMTVGANDVDTDGISLGRVNTSAVRDFDFAENQVLDRSGNAASNAIPTVNTSRIRVDATGPVVSAFGGFVTSQTAKAQQVSLRVTFDGPVIVTGKPRVPVTLGGEKQELVYTAGSGTSTLTFAVTLPKTTSVANPAFRGENDLPGEVILLPQGADLKDRLGNSVTTIGKGFGETYYDKYDDEGKPTGNRVVVIGAHYEYLGGRTQAELNAILNEELQDFRKPEVEAIEQGQAPFWEQYVTPDYPDVANDVDLYRVAYRSTIPEQGNRPTVAYGLVALPKGTTGPLPLVSYQHGALFLKESVPSQAFSWNKDDETPFKYGLSKKDFYDSCYETRLNVAQFAGKGYAVIAADYFGVGNSVENDGFFVKGSHQRACVDMYAAAQKLLAYHKVQVSHLFLNGWSQGGVVTQAFQEALEAKGVKISGVSTASAASNTEMFINRFIFNARPYSVVNNTPPGVPDGAWVAFIPQFASFSLGGYSGKTNTPLELLGGNYEISRKFYMREFVFPPSFTFEMNVRGEIVPVMTLDGVTRDAEVSKFIDQKFARDPRAFAKSTFAGLFRDIGVGKTRLESDMLMYYGSADEASPDSIATYIATWQRGTYGKTNLDQIAVPFASHRGTFLTAVDGQLGWFNSKREA
jgi:pimeloyl-ACP methyl ester carboxylesterase